MTANQASDELTSATTPSNSWNYKRSSDRSTVFHKTKNKADTYMNYTRPHLAITFESIKKTFLDAKNREVRLRYLTEITKGM